MFKSIYTRYVVTFMMIIIVSFALLASVICTMTVDYYTDSAVSRLKGETKSLVGLIEERIKVNGNSDLNTYMAENSGEIEAYLTIFYHTDTSVFITDDLGNVLVSIGIAEWSEENQYRVAGNIMKDAADGGCEGSGKLGEIFEENRSFCGMPVSDDERVIGLVFVCRSSDDLNVLFKPTVRAIIMTCLWVLLAALIAVYFVSDRIISPIKDMGKAAKQFAAGKFDVRVDARGHDEITELAIAFNDMASSLADLENMRSTFMSNVSHDLRTPMTTISGFIDGILDGTIPQEKHEYYLRIIGDEVRRLSRLVAALLDVSRIQAGDRKFVMEAFDICEMARVILISFEQKIDRKKLNVSFETDMENMYVKADHDAIYQILYNICDNAVKFSKDGGCYRIKISEHNKKVFVSVYNEGEGIKAKDLPHVFDRFYKGDKSRGLDKTGTGLGLYIAKSIIDAHGEEIWVKSMYGEYCEFVFTLSRAPDSEVKKIFDKNAK